MFVTPEEEAKEDAIDLRGTVLTDASRGDRQDRLLLAGRSPDDRDTRQHDVEHYFEVLVGELHPADRERIILGPARFSERELTTFSERISGAAGPVAGARDRAIDERPVRTTVEASHFFFVRS